MDRTHVFHADGQGSIPRAVLFYHMIIKKIFFDILVNEVSIFTFRRMFETLYFENMILELTIVQINNETKLLPTGFEPGTSLGHFNIK